jgi:hypothetical protein
MQRARAPILTQILPADNPIATLQDVGRGSAISSESGVLTPSNYLPVLLVYWLLQTLRHKFKNLERCLGRTMAPSHKSATHSSEGCGFLSGLPHS